MENKSDVLIIGGGPAGYLAAERLSQGGLSVSLFEKESLGGVCLNEGCIPTKTYLNSAKIYDYALNGAVYGVTAENVTFNHDTVYKRKQKVVKILVAGVNQKMKTHKVNVIKSAARLLSKENGLFACEADGNVYYGTYLMIASGSEPIIPPIPGLREAYKAGTAVSSREILELRKIPDKLTVIGGGVVGLEMAAYFNSAGSQVTVIEMLDKIAGYTDKEISELLLKDLQKKGIIFKLNSKVTEVTAGFISYEAEGKAEQVATDICLVSIGRRPSVSALNLEAIGMYTEQGAVVTDKHLRTNVPNAYAIGDVNGKIMLAHTAYREAEVASNHILGKKDYMRYDAVPSVIYTSPEVACVGESEESAADKGMDFEVKKLSMMYSGRFVAENNRADGLCKLLVERPTKRIIGVHIIGAYASEIIYGAAMMIESRWPVEDLKELVFPHPTVSEIIRETLFI